MGRKMKRGDDDIRRTLAFMQMCSVLSYISPLSSSYLQQIPKPKLTRWWRSHVKVDFHEMPRSYPVRGSEGTGDFKPVD